MKILRRIIAVIFAAVAAFLIFAVIHATTTPGGAKTGVAVGYIAGAIILLVAAGFLWRGRRSTV